MPTIDYMFWLALVGTLFAGYSAYKQHQQVRLMIATQTRGDRRRSQDIPPRASTWRRHWPIGVMVVLVGLVWVPYLYPPKARPAIALEGWGTSGGHCTMRINSRPLQPFQDTHNLVAACLIARTDIDLYENPLIATSRPFGIRGDSIAIEFPHTEEMKAAAIQRKGPREMNYKVILLPKGVDPASIKRLSDVPRLGGRFH
jgi:hypothetical protein